MVVLWSYHKHHVINVIKVVITHQKWIWMNTPYSAYLSQAIHRTSFRVYQLNR